jgi:hypothetical protein
MEEERREDEYPIECPFCRFRTKYFPGLKSHILGYHPQEFDEYCSKSKIERFKEQNLGERDHWFWERSFENLVYTFREGLEDVKNLSQITNVSQRKTLQEYGVIFRGGRGWEVTEEAERVLEEL